MHKLVCGTMNVGVQAVFYLETYEELKEVGDDCKDYLLACRNNNSEIMEMIEEKYKNERFVYNWLKREKELVEKEKENIACWVENGFFWRIDLEFKEQKEIDA